MRRNKLLPKIILSTFMLLSLIIKTSYALENNFLEISILEKDNKLIIDEEWNIQAEDTGVFNRTLPIDKASLKNIYIEQEFPTESALDFSEDYNNLSNTTTLNIKNDVQKGHTNVFNIQYSLELDKKTKADLIEALPNSLFTEKNINIDKIKLNINIDGHNKIDYIDKEKSQGKEFKQETSKSQVIDVLGKLFKILIRAIFVLIICFIGYVGAIFVYYRAKTKTKKFFKKKRKKTKTHFKTKR